MAPAVVGGLLQSPVHAERRLIEQSLAAQGSLSRHFPDEFEQARMIRKRFGAAQFKCKRIGWDVRQR